MREDDSEYQGGPAGREGEGHVLESSRRKDWWLSSRTSLPGDPLLSHQIARVVTSILLQAERQKHTLELCVREESHPGSCNRCNPVKSVHLQP